MKSSFFLALVAFGGLVDAAQYTVTPTDNWKQRIQTLAAGDTMTFTKGTYPITGKFSVSFPGTAAAPIVVKGEDGAVIRRDAADQNNMDIGGSSYFTIENLEFIGGSKGLRFGETGNIDNAIIRNNSIHGTATTAVTFNDGQKQYTNIQFIHNEIYDTGAEESECLYMGCNQNACTASNCLIEYNFCHDTLQATSGSLGSGIQVKTGSNNIKIRNNVCVDTKGPGILIYDDYDLGENLVQGNFIWRSGDNGIQATAGANIINNIVVSASGYGIAIQANQPQTGKSIRNVAIAGNTILSPNGISVADSDQGSTFQVLNNAVFASGNALTLRPTGLQNAGNVASASADADLLSSSTTSPNVYPKAGSKLIAAGSTDASTLVTVDFNGNKRASPPSVGAYEYSTATNPGWQLAKGFKGAVVSNGDEVSTAVATTLSFFVILLACFINF